MRNFNDEVLLNTLCDLYGSDKGSVSDSSTIYWWEPHNYTKIYSALFNQRKNDINVVFECGLGTNNPDFTSSMGINGKPGASLRVWRDYFPKASIYGADIDSGVLFLEDRITTGYMNQEDPESVANFWKNHPVYPDIIIDDGLHEYSAGICLFQNSFDRLKPGGIYVIEDVNQSSLTSYREYFDKSYLDVMVVSLNRPIGSWGDNTLIVIFKDQD
jgi:hypothetical protein